MTHNNCLRCKRVLKNEKARQAGYGSVCIRKLGLTPSNHELVTKDELIADPPDGSIFLERVPTGIRSNVPHKHVVHSPTGFEFGYGGSGPADLALNILVKIGVPFHLAMALHQDFKWEFIAPICGDITMIPLDKIEDWVVKKVTSEKVEAVS